MKTITKVYAYILQADDLVVFRQPAFPEAGIQVPGGTVQPEEAPDVAVLREAYEETNLEGLSIVRCLGDEVRDMRYMGKNAIHHRYFYHLECAAPIPPSWEHYERFSTHFPDQPILFAFSRIALNAVPQLIADLDVFLDDLRH